MTMEEAKARFTEYLKSHFIRFMEDDECGENRCCILYTGYELCPDRRLESSVWFLPDHMEVRVYYSKSGARWCRESEYKPQLMRLLNYINARAWPMAVDGKGGALYEPHILYSPRIYMTEDGNCDITLTLPINYTFYETALLETEDFATACCPSLMNSLSPAIFRLLLGDMDVEHAMDFVRVNVLGEDAPSADE